MIEYWIPRDVYLCIVDGMCVWLDVRRDKYFGTKATDSGRVAALVEGWPGAERSEDCASPVCSEDSHSVADGLLVRGLLTRHKEGGKAATPVCLERPLRQLIADDEVVRPRVRVLHVWRFAVAVVMTLLTWKAVSFGYALRAVERRKRLAGRRGARVDLQIVRELVAVFSWLTTFLFTSKEQCFFRSVAEMWFLTAYGACPTLAIGVAARPFRAHCWVQQAGWVFNCEVEVAAGFSPIYTI